MQNTQAVLRPWLALKGWHLRRKIARGLIPVTHISVLTNVSVISVPLLISYHKIRCIPVFSGRNLLITPRAVYCDVGEWLFEKPVALNTCKADNSGQMLVDTAVGLLDELKR